MKNKNREQIKKHWILFWEFFKIGLFTIGGGMAMIPLIQKLVVEDKKWLDEDETVDCLAVSQALPGVIAINSATYIGKKICGLTGAIATTLGVVAPSFIIILILVHVLDLVTGNPTVNAAFLGIKAAVCGLVVVSAIRLGKKILTGLFQWTLAIVALIMIAVFDITAVWAIIVGAVAGILYHVHYLNRRSG